MSIPDGEYDLDLSVLAGSQVDSSAFAVRYGFVPESMDQSKPMVLYDAEDNQNLILAAKDNNDEDMIFEGAKQTHNTKNSGSGGGAYYLALVDGKFQLHQLDNTIRVNKSRNTIKWKNVIKKWNSEHESRHIISESDFEDLDLPEFKMQFEENDLEFDREPEESEEQTQAELQERKERDRERELTAKELGEKEQREKELKEKEHKERLRQREQELKEKERKEREIREKELKQKEVREKELKQKEVREKELKEKEVREKELKEKELKQKELKEKEIREKEIRDKEQTEPRPSEIPSRVSVAGKRVSGKLVPRKRPKAEDDDFEDLENQLQEALDSDNDDSDDYNYIGEPIKVIENNSSKTKTPKPGNHSSKRPMSLRAFMGDKRDDDLSSSEEE